MTFYKRKINKEDEKIDEIAPYRPEHHEPIKNRKFGEDTLIQRHKEMMMFLNAFVIIKILTAICCIFIEYGYLIIIGLIPIDIVFYILCDVYLIKIPYATVLWVKLRNDGYMDECGIVQIPLHILKTDYEIVGQQPPLRTLSENMIYISDDFDAENRIIYQPFDTKSSNMRYVAQKNTFVDLKKEYKEYAEKNLRRILVEDITILGYVENVIEFYNKMIFEEPEKYFRSGTTMDKGMFKTSEIDIMNKLTEISAERRKELEEIEKENGGNKNGKK
jgi:hypothetical protein